MDLKTFLAVGELAQAAAHAQGLVGPVEFTVCPNRNKFGGKFDDDVPPHDCPPEPKEEFFYAGNL